jgi:hypothetical protein
MTVKFADFATDPAVCREAEVYWQHKFAQLPCRPFEHGWREWGTTTYLYEEGGGNIFAAQHAQARRGLVVVMWREMQTTAQVVAWTSWFGGDANDPESIANLKINLVHTDDTEKIALTLLTRFVCDGASLAEMDALIHELGADEEPPL